MAFRLLALAATAVLAAPLAMAQTSTFVNNGGVHESAEYASDSFQAPVTSIFDKFTFSLASNITGLESDVTFVGRPPISGTVSLYKDAVIDTLVGSYAFSVGSGAFGALAAGDYYYTVAASGSNGGAFALGSYITPVPEAETAAMMLGGLGAIGLMLRRRQS